MRFVDACAGIGGFHLGITQAINAECVLAIEKDKHCKKVYYQNFPKVQIADDITTIPAEDIPKHDLFCAGLPCQPFSICGNHKGFDDIRGTIFFDIVRILQYHKPKYAILENVPQLLTHDKGKTISVICNYLGDLGYFPSIHILNSIDYGLAQYRKRCFIICGFDFKPQSSLYISLLKNILEPKVDHKYYIDEPYYITSDSMYSKNIEKPCRIGHIKEGRQGERIYSVLAPSITLTAQGGGLAGKTGIYLTGNKKYHKMQYCTGGIRKLTPRECARLQGFPESFEIHNSDAQAYKQFGNAVSVNVVQNIVEQI